MIVFLNTFKGRTQTQIESLVTYVLRFHVFTSENQLFKGNLLDVWFHCKLRKKLDTGALIFNKNLIRW